MRAMTGVRTNQPSSLSIPHSSPSCLPLLPSVHSSRLPLFVHCRIGAIPCHPVHPLSFFIPLFPLSLPSYPLSSSLSGITLVDKTSPVDEPSDSDQVTEGVKFTYTLPHQQSNQEDSQDDTALVCVHIHACVSVCVICILVCI